MFRSWLKKAFVHTLLFACLVALVGCAQEPAEKKQSVDVPKQPSAEKQPVTVAKPQAAEKEPANAAKPQAAEPTTAQKPVPELAAAPKNAEPSPTAPKAPAAAQAPKSLAASDNEEQWQKFTKEASQHYGLNEAQAKAAEAALQSCLTRAATRREEHKKAVQVADQAKDAAARDKADAALRTALNKLGDENVGRIDAIATVEQVEKAAKAGFESPRRKNPIPKPDVGFAAPLFELKAPDDKIVSLAALKGKVVVLHFWASWCPHCKKALPEMAKFQESIKDNPKITLYGIACAQRPNSPDPIALAKEAGCSYQVLLNGDSVSKAYEVQGFPTLYVVGPDGKIIDKWRGEQSNVNARLDPIIKKALEDYEKQGKKS
jgi:cytochrome c biogenesis protein CcmG, thiol:disulfide interchange protein DsbE